MTPYLSHYLDRLYATIHSRQEITVKEIEFFDQSVLTGRTSELVLRHCLWDGSLLEVYEALVVRGCALVKVRYRYHYRRKDDTLIFRYDNAPHYPDLSGFPEYKHEGDQVFPAPAPDRSQVLKEIDGHPYPDPSTDREETAPASKV